LEVLDNKALWQTFDVFVEISAKNDKFGYLNPILEKLGMMHDFD